MIVCWSSKGGSGSSVTAALLALSVSNRVPALLADTQGDQAAILGVPGDHTVGWRQWISAGKDVSAGALGRLAVPVTASLRLLPSGPPSDSDLVTDESLSSVIQSFAGEGQVVVDAGLCTASDDVAGRLASTASASLMVIRPCFLALKRASALSVRATGVVVVEEGSRSLDARDIEQVLQVPVVARVPLDPGIARAVDAGRLIHKRFKSPRSIDELAATLLQRNLDRAG